MVITREFKFEKATKNTFRFREVLIAGDERTLVIGTLYVKQSAFDTQPDKLKVTVEDA